MKVLLVIWTAVRIAFEAAVWATRGHLKKGKFTYAKEQ